MDQTVIAGVGSITVMSCLARMIDPRRRGIREAEFDAAFDSGNALTRLAPRLGIVVRPEHDHGLPSYLLTGRTWLAAEPEAVSECVKEEVMRTALLEGRNVFLVPGLSMTAWWLAV